MIVMILPILNQDKGGPNLLRLNQERHAHYRPRLHHQHRCSFQRHQHHNCNKSMRFQVRFMLRYHRLPPQPQRLPMTEICGNGAVRVYPSTASTITNDSLASEEAEKTKRRMEQVTDVKALPPDAEGARVWALSLAWTIRGDDWNASHSDGSNTHVTQLKETTPETARLSNDLLSLILKCASKHKANTTVEKLCDCMQLHRALEVQGYKVVSINSPPSTSPAGEHNTSGRIATAGNGEGQEKIAPPAPPTEQAARVTGEIVNVAIEGVSSNPTQPALASPSSEDAKELFSFDEDTDEDLTAAFTAMQERKSEDGRRISVINGRSQQIKQLSEKIDTERDEKDGVIVRLTKVALVSPE